MTSLNKWIGIGRIGSETKSSMMPNGTMVTNIRIACSETYKDKHGEKKENVEWINIVYFGKNAEFVDKYMKKGDLIYVEGKIKSDKYICKDTGIEKFSTKIMAESTKIISRCNKDISQSLDNDSTQQHKYVNNKNTNFSKKSNSYVYDKNSRYQDMQLNNTFDDDLPF